MNQTEVVALIQSEMKPSMGCTEPVAIGLAVSNTCWRLKLPVEQVHIKLSSNIFKNAYSVKLPNTSMTGIPMAAALGILLAKKENTMEIFSAITETLSERAEQLLTEGIITLEVKPDNRFYIEVTARAGEEEIRTITVDRHDNLVFMEENGKILKNAAEPQFENEEDNTFPIMEYSFRKLIKLCETIPLAEIEFLREGVEMNRTVSQAGMDQDCGLNVGKRIRDMVHKGLLPDDMASYVKSKVAAACDCRMGGKAFSAMTVLGSGNQGFEAILLPASAAEYLHSGEEKMLRSVMMSILLTIYIKYHVGRLSPICGATLSGAAGAGAVAWLLGGGEEAVEGAVQNMLGNLSGMLCDGAKDGCALKLGNCAGEAVLAANLAIEGSIIRQTDGIISCRVEDTIKNVARLSKEGMSEVDMNIISIMLNKEMQPPRETKDSGWENVS